MLGVTGNISSKYTTKYQSNTTKLYYVYYCSIKFYCVCLIFHFIFESVDKKNQLDVTFCILYFSSNSCSTCFGQPCAHHHELTTA